MTLKDEILEVISKTITELEVHHCSLGTYSRDYWISDYIALLRMYLI